MQIHERLQLIITDNKKLSEYIGVNPAQVCRWKYNQAEMGIYKLKALCQYYNVSADWVLGLSDEKDTVELSRELAEKLRNEINHALK